MDGARYPIQLVARLTGLSPHVLRIWEQRYRVVEPMRTPTKRRLYTQEHVDRLKLLRSLTGMGHRIGQLASLSTEQLRALASEVAGQVPFVSPSAGLSAVRGNVRLAHGTDETAWLREALSAVRSLDARALEDVLRRGGMELGALGALQRLVAPLARAIGEGWRAGELTAAHEHFATAVIRVYLGNSASAFGSLEGAPVLVVATPAGQIHELGAMLVGATAANLGWKVTYLGPSLPAAEIAGAARQSRARAVALSLVYPEDDPRMEGELVRLREALPPDVALLAGGRAMPAFRPLLGRLGILAVEDLAHLGATLDGLRGIGSSPHHEMPRPTSP